MPEQQTAAPRKAGTHWVVTTAAVGGVAAYAFQLLGTRVLGPVDFAPIGLLWTIQYLVLSVALLGVESLVTRRVVVDGATGLLGPTSRKLLLCVAGGSIAATAAAFVASNVLLQGRRDLSVIVGLICFTYGVLAVVRGHLAGQGEFRRYGLTTATESGTRLLLGAVVLWLAPSTTALAWILPIGPVIAVLLVVRAVVHADAPVSTVRTGDSSAAFLASNTATNAAAQALLAAGPLLLLPLGATSAAVSVFFVTSTAARLPMTFLLGGGVSRVLVPLSRLAAGGETRKLWRLSLAGAWTTAAVAALAGGGAAIAGIPLISLAFGAAFAPDRGFIVLTAVGTVLATGGLLLNQVLVASHRERSLVAPWWAGVLAAGFAVLATPGSPTTRVAVGFVVGEVVALALLMTAIRAGLLATAKRHGARSSAEVPGPAPQYAPGMAAP